MKRYGNLYSKIYDINNLTDAYNRAKRGKSWYKEVIDVENNEPLLYLVELQYRLINKTYETSPYEVFTKLCGNKEREIYKLPFFPDRICQSAIMLQVEDIFIKSFTKDTYSAIPKRGIHLALRRIRKEMKEDKEGMKYCLKIDIKKFYPNINHDILKSKLRDKFKDNDLLWLLDEIIDSIDGNKGVPIGNYTSQYFGNFFLSDFDHWIKEEKRVKHYFRYLDDMCFFSSNKESLHVLLSEIKEYLKGIDLELKYNYQIFPTDIRGVDFVGYVIRPTHTRLRKSIKLKLSKKMNKINKKKVITLKDKATIASYKGWLIHCDSINLQKKYFASTSTQ